MSTTTQVPTVVYDACALYPSTGRDLLVRLSIARLVYGRVTSRILDETFHSIERTRPDLSPERLAGTRRKVVEALGAYGTVVGYEHRIGGLDLPDPDDRHVLAAAIETGAHLIVTDNLKDFPDDRLATWSIRAVSPDDLVSTITGKQADPLMGIVQDIAASTTKRRRTVDTVLQELDRSGYTRTVGVLRAHSTTPPV